MNKRVEDDIATMRLHLDKVGSLYTNILLSDDFMSMSVEDMKKLSLAMKHRNHCDDRLFELYYKESS